MYMDGYVCVYTRVRAGVRVCVCVHVSMPFLLRRGHKRRTSCTNDSSSAARGSRAASGSAARSHLLERCFTHAKPTSQATTWVQAYTHVNMHARTRAQTGVRVCVCVGSATARAHTHTHFKMHTQNLITKILSTQDISSTTSPGSHKPARMPAACCPAAAVSWREMLEMRC